jgi:hypothetical protein
LDATHRTAWLGIIRIRIRSEAIRDLRFHKRNELQCAAGLIHNSYSAARGDLPVALGI